METESRQKNEYAKKLATEKKVKIKERMNRRLMENLESCKAHGGLITEKDLSKLELLIYKQLVVEVSLSAFEALSRDHYWRDGIQYFLYMIFEVFEDISASF